MIRRRLEYIPHILWANIDDTDYKYMALNKYRYLSKRFNRAVTIEIGFKSDGASGAWDIKSDSWGIHDKICQRGTWDDGTLLSNFDASTVLSDILRSEGRYFRAVYWWAATFCCGGGKCRANGMMKIYL